MPDSTSKPVSNLFNLSLLLAALASGFALAVYAYLGIFSRHMADDYCSVGFIRVNFFSALWDNYLTVSDRYSNFMLIALSEWLSPSSTTILPALMIVLWILGIAVLFRESLRFAGMRWPPIATGSLALLPVFFALLEAPNRFQTLYWRSSMATHLAPLVLMPYFASFLIHSISSARQAPLALWTYPLVFLLAFLLGGFSEPTVLIMISLLSLSFLLTWIWMKRASRVSSLCLLGFSLLGAMTALLVMIIAPANSLRLGDPPPALPVLIERSFRFAFDFVLNAFRTLPLPTFFTVLTPFIIFLGLNVAPHLTNIQQKHLLITALLMPVFAYLLVVASFAPSVYGQSFPVERARFAGQFILVTMLMVEGAIFGILLAAWASPGLRNFPLSTVAALLLIIVAIYPLRAGLVALKDVPAYQARAAAWDKRQAQIFSFRAEGQTDLIVEQYNGVDGVKELDTNPNHWINRCAAGYYGVNSISAIPNK